MTTDADAPETVPDVASPPERTTTRVVPVTVPREVERAARARAERHDVALEDAIADHVRVVPAWCFSPAEEGPADARRNVLHTPVEPATAALVDDLAAGDRRQWIREAIHEKARREADGAAATVASE